MALMRAQRGTERRLREVADAVLRRVPADDLRDLRIVSVRYAREEVMLDLVVEPAERPGEHGIARAEVDGRLDLVHGPEPLVGRELLRRRITGLLDAMRELERRRGHEPRRRREGEIADDDDPPRVDEERDDHRPADEDRL